VRFSAPLIPARFLERRQRFLARVELPDQRRGRSRRQDHGFARKNPAPGNYPCVPPPLWFNI